MADPRPPGAAPRIDVRKELRRLIREALDELGGTGGKRECRYCNRESFPGQPEHWRKGFKSEQYVETEDHCAVTVMKAALKALGAK